jgi:hypothetical protein
MNDPNVPWQATNNGLVNNDRATMNAPNPYGQVINSTDPNPIANYNSNGFQQGNSVNQVGKQSRVVGGAKQKKKRKIPNIPPKPSKYTS